MVAVCAASRTIGMVTFPACSVHFSIFLRCVPYFRYRIRIFGLPLYLRTLILHLKWTALSSKICDVLCPCTSLTLDYFLLLESNILGVHHPMALGPLATLVAYAAINVEKKSRRKELALYMLNLCIEALFRMGVARGYWRPVKHGLSFIFAIASAGLLGFYNSERQSLGNIKTGLDVFVGEVELPDFADRFLARSVLPNHWSQFKKWVVSGFIKMTAVGFGLRFMGVFLSIIFASSLRRRLKVLGRGLGMGARFGLFLGLFSTISRLAPSVLMKLFGLPKTAASIVSGFVAGASSVFYPSTEMSLYMLVKLFDAIFNAAVARKKVTPIPGGDSLVFAITTGFLFYVGVFEHFCIRRRYWRTLCRVSTL
jgi:hypothetical protein